MKVLNLRWRVCSSPGVVRPCCCAAADGSMHHSSTQTTCKHRVQSSIRHYALREPHRGHEPLHAPVAAAAAAAIMAPQFACTSAHNGRENAEQQLWLPHLHTQILLQMKQPAQQVHNEIRAQQGLHTGGLQPARIDAGELVCNDRSIPQRLECHSMNYFSSSANSSHRIQCSRPATTWRGGYIIAAAEAVGLSNQGSSSDSSSSTSSSSNSGSLKSIRERMRQRVTSRVTQSPQHPQAAAAAPDRAAALPAAAPTSKPLPTILPAATNENSISDVLQQLQQKLGNSNNKHSSHSKAALHTSSSSSASPGEESAARSANNTLVVRKRRQQDQQPSISSKEQEQQTREFMAQHKLQLLHQEQQQRKRQQLMQKAQMKEQRAAAFKQLQASADAALKQHAGRKGTANQPRNGLTGESSSSSCKALKPAKARVYKEQLASRRRTMRCRAADTASAVIAAAAAADANVAAKPVLRRRIAATAPAPGSAGAAAAGGKAAAKPRLKQRATQLGLELELLRGLAAIVAKTEAPDVVQQQLLADYAAGKPGIPRNPIILARRLMHFSQAAELLGGPDRACNILERDTSLLLMAPALLQRKLQNLQRSLTAAGDAETAVENQDGEGSSSCSSNPETYLNETELAAAGPAGIPSSSRSSSADSDVSSSVTTCTHFADSSSSFKPGAEVLGLVRSHPGLLHLSVSGLEHRLAVLQGALGLSSIQEVVQVVRWQPRVLSMNEEALHDKVWGMAATIHVPPVAIQSLYTKQPLLLNLSASTLTDKAAALKTILGLSAQQLWEMLSCKPGVLLFSSSKISTKWAALQQLAGSHPRWRSELAELSPSSLVQLLTASEARLARLHHVAAVGGQDLQALYYTVNQQTERHFKAKFKTYDAWLARGKKKQGISVGAGAAAATGAG